MKANTRVTVLRGGAEDELGDVIDVDTPVLHGLPMTIIEVSATTIPPGESAPRTVRQVVGRSRYGLDIRPLDKLLDEATGEVYQVDARHNPVRLLSGSRQVRYDLRVIEGQ